MATSEAMMEQPKVAKPSKSHKLFSWPLFMQSLKANWVLWVVLTGGMAAMLMIINYVIGSKSLFTQIDMSVVNLYIEDENLNWLVLLGFLQTMGFSLNKIQVMSQLDMTEVLNNIVYNIAGVLLPMVFIIITSNKLIASQVDSGSMAYVLSTPTNRKRVVLTQLLFLVVALAAMYLVVTGAGVLSEWLGYKSKAIPLRTVIYCLGGFVAMLAFGGICFMASCIFNRSKNSLAIGGGFCIFSFLATILGLFGTKVFVSMGLGVSAMNAFNYVSLLTLYNTESISLFAKAMSGYDVEASFTWIYELAILLGVGVVTSTIGGVVFCKKDLPL